MKPVQFYSMSALVLAVTACSAPSASPQTADDIERQRTAQTEQQMAEALRQVEPPAIINFQQLRFQTFLYELLDQAIATHTYYSNLDGELIYVCPSIGYGMNASIQIVNPERVWTERGYQSITGGTIPQPEPNGLYMPEGLAATYAMCSDGEGGIRPVYVEQDLMVLPYEAPHVASIWPGYENVGSLEQTEVNQ